MNLFDIGGIQSALTVISFVAFVGIVAWAWSGRQAREFAEAARIPLEDDRLRAGEGARDIGKEER